jgi:hypothetical protein
VTNEGKTRPEGTPCLCRPRLRSDTLLGPRSGSFFARSRVRGLLSDCGGRARATCVGAAGLEILECGL